MHSKYDIFKRSVSNLTLFQILIHTFISFRSYFYGYFIFLAFVFATLWDKCVEIITTEEHNSVNNMYYN